MAKFSNFLRGFRGLKTQTESEPTQVRGIPTIKFDPSRVTASVKNEVRSTILALPEIAQNNFEQTYDAAIRSISAGGDLYLLTNALIALNVDGMTKRRAANIARLLNRRATSIMDRERQTALGIKHAIWLYSGAPCMLDPKKATSHDIQRDEAHKAANGKEFEVVKGMHLNGKWTWPGVDPGCKCVSRAKIAGFS